MTYGSVCSGIEAATVAWHSLGWKAAWYSEIEKFPCAVLAHHYSDTPNLGDMTKIKMRPEFNERPIDLLVGGTPCQSFSVAGLRKGMDDPRGNLALVFLGIAERTRAKWVVWENVPGVLSSKQGRDFGSFLGGLAQLGYGWAYRVLDAQYFGVPQRRQRVFVVGYLGDWRRAAAVFFESASLSGNSAPSRQAGQDVAGTIRGGSEGQGGSGITEDIALVTHSLRGEGYDASEDGTGRGTPIVACESGQGYWRIGAGPLRAEGENRPSRPSHVVVPILEVGARTGKSTDDKRAGMGVGDPGDPMFTLQSGKQHAIAFGSKDGGQDALEDVSPTLRAGGHDGSHPNGGVPPAVCYDMRGHGDGENAPTLTGHHAGAISDFSPVVFTQGYLARGMGPRPSSEVTPTFQSNAGDQHPCVFQQNSRSEVREMGDRSGAVTSEPGAQCQNYLKSGMAVRRLTPRECERLQGFPDDYTLIAWRGKPREECPDGPRYKAIGNSMAVPVMRWIGRRIQMVEEI